MHINDIGWNGYFEAHFHPFKEKNLTPARVSRQHKNLYIVVGEFGEFQAELTGKFLFNTNDKLSFPAVGDWVAGQIFDGEDKMIIHEVLPRKSSFIRKEAGLKTQGQIVAANIDTLFLICGLDDDFNLRRIERYMTEIYDSGASPVVILNKSDLCDMVDERIDQVQQSAVGVPVFAVSAEENIGLEEIQEYLKPGQTGAFIGSSGVGKSTIINRLIGFDKMLTRNVSLEKSKGRHTTTHRELIILENKSILIDTPGMRALKLWSDEENLQKSFDDISSMAQKCRYHDCSHDSEPGCAIKEAVESGELDQKRFDNYLKMLREIRFNEERKSSLAKHHQKVKGRKFSKMVSQAIKLKNKGFQKK